VVVVVMRILVWVGLVQLAKEIMVVTVHGILIIQAEEVVGQVQQAKLLQMTIQLVQVGQVLLLQFQVHL
jgi:hypothetical protein